MKHSNNRILPLLVAVLAVANLIALFVFHYGLPAETRAVRAAQAAARERAAYVPASSEKEEAESGAEETEGASSAAETAYAGPSITLDSELPSVTTDDLYSIVQVLADLGKLSADDGYGNDLTQAVRADCIPEEGEDSSYSVVFSVINDLGDSAEASAVLEVTPGNLPVLLLTEDRTILSVGDEFNYLTYIRAARDVDGASLSDRIRLDGSVDTAEAGEYTLTYSVKSKATDGVAEAVLVVTVQ